MWRQEHGRRCSFALFFQFIVIYGQQFRIQRANQREANQEQFLRGDMWKNFEFLTINTKEWKEETWVLTISGEVQPLKCPWWTMNCRFLTGLWVYSAWHIEELSHGYTPLFRHYWIRYIPLDGDLEPHSRYYIIHLKLEYLGISRRTWNVTGNRDIWADLLNISTQSQELVA